MIKQNTHLFLVIIVFFDLIFLIFSYLASRYLTFLDIGLSSWTIKEIIISILIIGFLYISL